MSFSKILEKLFKNSGQGPSLSDNVTTELVHKTGNETIAGEKTFNNASVNLKSPDIQRTVPSTTENKHLSLVFRDKDDYILGACQYMSRVSGQKDIKFSCYTPENTTIRDEDMVGLWLGYDANGVPFAAAPSTSSLRSYGPDVVTRDWIPNDSRIVHTTGNETVGGIKQFNDYIFSSFSIAKGTIPSGGVNQWRGIYFLDNTATFDSFGIAKRFGWMEQSIGDDGGSALSLCACKNAANSSEYATMSVGVDLDGIHYGTCPSTSSSRSEGTDIVTRNWIPNDTRIVHTTGNESISGSKTFNETYTNLKSSTIGRTVHPSTNNQNLSLVFLDKDDYVLGACQYINRTTGGVDIKISCYDPTKTTVDDGDLAGLYVGWDENNVRFANAPSTSSSRNVGSDIVTRDWIPQDTRIVHRTGDESIGGRKAFQIDTYFVNTLWKKGTTPSGSNVWRSLIFANDGGSDSTLAKNMIAIVQGGLLTDGTSGLQFTAIKNTANNSSALHLQFLYNKSNDKGFFRPGETNLVSLGTSNYYWSTVYAGTTTIQSSDERVKESISSISDEVLDAWEDIEWKQFQFKDSVSEKGTENARIHTGLIAQQIGRIFESHDLDASRWGLYCYDKWDAVAETRNENGEIEVPAQPAGDAYALRYGEVLCLEAAYMRRKVARLEARIAELEKSNSAV